MIGHAKRTGPKIRALGAPDSAPHIEGLLQAAGIKSTPEAKSDLDSTLQLAWAETHSQASAPAELLTELEDSIKKTRQLLQRVEAFPGSRDMGCDVCHMGDGAFNITTVREMRLGRLVLSRNPPPVRWPPQVAPDEFMAAINRKRTRQVVVRDTPPQQAEKSGGSKKTRPASSRRSRCLFFSTIRR
jgi:hypothetical protein